MYRLGLCRMAMWGKMECNARDRTGGTAIQTSRARGLWDMEVDNGMRCASIANRRGHDETVVSLGRHLG